MVRGGTGMAYKDAHPYPPPFPSLWAPYPDFVIPLSFHVKLVCKPPFYLIFMLISNALSL